MSVDFPFPKQRKLLGILVLKYLLELLDSVNYKIHQDYFLNKRVFCMSKKSQKN